MARRPETQLTFEKIDHMRQAANAFAARLCDAMRMALLYQAVPGDGLVTYLARPNQRQSVG